MKHKRLYYTRYSRRFTSHVWAANVQDAEEKARARGLGETIIWEGETPPKSPFDRPASHHIDAKAEVPFTDWDDATHALTFLAHLAISSGVSKPADWLSDTGILHEWLHLGAGLTSRKPARLRAEILRRVRSVERKVPGYLP